MDFDGWDWPKVRKRKETTHLSAETKHPPPPLQPSFHSSGKTDQLLNLRPEGTWDCHGLLSKIQPQIV